LSEGLKVLDIGRIGLSKNKEEVGSVGDEYEHVSSEYEKKDGN
jgi:hypothetical protein